MKITVIGVSILILTAALALTAFGQKAMPQPQEFKLLNGLRVLMWQEPSASDVTVKIRIHSGSAFDPQGKEGVMKMLSENLFPNDAARDFFAEDLGGRLEIISNYDYIEVDASAKSEHFLTMMETLADAVSKTIIDEETTARLKTSMLADVTKLESKTSYVADRAASNRLFGNFPYGRPQAGTPGAIKAMHFADLLDARKRFLTADNATVTIRGNFNKSLSRKAVTRYFGIWQKSDGLVPSTFRQPEEPEAGLLIVPSPQPDDHAIRFAFRGVARKSPDFAASMVIAKVIQDRLKAIAPTEYADDVFVRSEANTLPGMILVGLDGKSTDIGSAHGKIEPNDLVKKAFEAPLTDAEFRSARSDFQKRWSEKEMMEFWLDADTYKTNGPAADAQLADKVTFEDARAYFAAARKQPIVTVLVNTPREEK